MEKIQFSSRIYGQDTYGFKSLFIEDENTFNLKDYKITPSTEGSVFGFDIRMEKIPNERIKKFLAPFSKTERLKKLDLIASSLNFMDNDSWGRTYVGFTKDNQRYNIVFEGETRLTLDDIVEILGVEITTLPKSFWRGAIQDINLSGSSKSLLMDIIRKDRVDIFRVIGKQGTQFTKDELKEIIALPFFLRKTTSGIIGGGETADIVNRRAVILHQDAADEEIVMDIINSFELSEVHEKERFFKTLGKKSVVEKYKDSPSIQILLKLR
jgi:hypothetical protein